MEKPQPRRWSVATCLIVPICITVYLLRLSLSLTITADASAARDFVVWDGHAHAQGHEREHERYHEVPLASPHADMRNRSMEAGPAQDRTTPNIAPAIPNLPNDHPHAGARFPNGTWGYVADVSRVRKEFIRRYYRQRPAAASSDSSAVPMSFMPMGGAHRYTNRSIDGTSSNTRNQEQEEEEGDEFSTICNTPPKEGPEKKAGYRLLSTRVKVDVSASTPTLGWDDGAVDHGRSHHDDLEQEHDVDPSRHASRILCTIYTHGDSHYRIRGIRDTWGWRCDGFLAASTQTIDDPSENGFGAVDLPHVGEESYENMWQKVRSIWAYVYDNYLESFDYFYISGDDTHLIVENLKMYLSSITETHKKETERDTLFLGHWIPRKSSYYVGGGPGYLLNRKAVRILVERALPSCRKDAIASSEDRFVSDCLRLLDVLPNSTVDASGAQRFHGMHPHFVASFAGDKGFYKEVYDFWGTQFGHRTKFDLVSTQSVSFHGLKSPKSMKRHHAILYRSCPRGTVLGDALFAVDSVSSSNANNATTTRRHDNATTRQR